VSEPTGTEIDAMYQVQEVEIAHARGYRLIAHALRKMDDPAEFRAEVQRIQVEVENSLGHESATPDKKPLHTD
jgi:hypothetical protein